MSGTHAEFRALLESTFRDEAHEHMQVISDGLMKLERARGDEALKMMELIFRATHTLKGAARAVDFIEIESLCQPLEDSLSSWRHEGNVPPPEALDSIHRTLDEIAALLEPAVAGGGMTGPSIGHLRLSASPSQRDEAAVVRQTLSSTVRTDGVDEVTADFDREMPSPARSAKDDTVRLSVAKVEAVLRESEELLAVKLIAGQRAADLSELGQHIEALRRAWASAESDVRSLRQPGLEVSDGRERRVGQELARLLDVFDSSAISLKALEGAVTALDRKVEQDRLTVTKLVDGLLEDAKKLLLLPFGRISTSFSKMVRDLCRDQGKEADFTIHGEEVELDKRVLEGLKDPIIHLLRNCVDHGIEISEERTRGGKPARAAITLALSRVDGSKVQLLLSDDGRGIDVEKVKETALRQQLISAEQAAELSEAAAQRLIFHSQLSTSPVVTQLSGRGLGLTIVQEKAEAMGGTVSVESRRGAGTTFRIIMPTTRATFRGVLVEAAGQLLVVPTDRIERVGRTPITELPPVEGGAVISFDDRLIPVLRLDDVLHISDMAGPLPRFSGAPFFVIGSGEARVAFIVDAVRDEREVLVKPLRKPLSRVRNVMGITVLGCGRVAAILNADDLLESARVTEPARRARAAELPTGRTHAILLAEDSITSRMLLKTILETAGYVVTTAVDGMEAFTLLRAEQFDLVVSDVEMPRLNGFDLTARIRADGKLSEIPVVLVTALDSREDRERGIDSGANAYIIKGSFDQSDLLEAVGRLI